MLRPVEYPELFFGICSPIGIDNKGFYELLKHCLLKYQYECQYIKVTELMKRIHLPDVTLQDAPFEARYDTYIKYANRIREISDRPDILAALCCNEIRARRTKPEGGQPNKCLSKVGYCFDQFKREEEINLLRQIYGNQFIAISLYSDIENRRDEIATKVSRDNSCPRVTGEHKKAADLLIAKDQNEEDDPFGQRLEDAFPIADLFLDVDNSSQAQELLVRFLDGLFGGNSVSPTRDEYGINIARNAAFRSIDLSRQVGAAICTKDGEIITTGCNEVPKAGGGIYGTEDDAPHRDAEKGFDSNEGIKRSLLVDFTKALSKIGLLNLKNGEKGNDEKIAQLIANETARGGHLRNVLLMDLLEFGRMVHAEMCAICEAARLGKSLKGAMLYCTTFPCHLCAKLIIASGISRVIYIEPYPKSYTQDFHREEIHVGRMQHNGRVMFEPFIGIAPRQYKAIFSRGRRKDDQGVFEKWAAPTPRPKPYEPAPHPIIKLTNTSYTKNEEDEIASVNEVLAAREKAGLLKLLP